MSTYSKLAQEYADVIQAMRGLQRATVRDAVRFAQQRNPKASPPNFRSLVRAGMKKAKAKRVKERQQVRQRFSGLRRALQNESAVVVGSHVRPSYARQAREWW